MALTPTRLVGAEPLDTDPDASLRPLSLADFTGQAAARKNLSVFIEAARARGEALDHVLFVGPPGLGKTTLAQIVARELGVNFRSTSGPVIAKAGDLAAQLTALEDRDVLFIDEIHRLNPAVEEILYPAMEDFQLDLMIGEGPGARSVKIDLAKFTLVGATTRAGLLTTPLRDRFGIPIRLEFYTVAELQSIVRRGARVLGIGMSADGANEIAKRARGTPRIAGRLLRRVRDFALVDGEAEIGRAVADKALGLLDVDKIGLDQMDRRYLTTIALSFGGGPVGIETMAAALSEPRDAIEDIIEPYLIQQGFLQRTPRGQAADAARLRASGACRAGAGDAAVRAVRRWGRVGLFCARERQRGSCADQHAARYPVTKTPTRRQTASGSAGDDSPTAVDEDRHRDECDGEHRDLGPHRTIRAEKLRKERAVEKQRLRIGQRDQERAGEDRPHRFRLRACLVQIRGWRAPGRDAESDESRRHRSNGASRTGGRAYPASRSTQVP